MSHHVYDWKSTRTCKNMDRGLPVCQCGPSWHVSDIRGEVEEMVKCPMGVRTGQSKEQLTRPIYARQTLLSNMCRPGSGFARRPKLAMKACLARLVGHNTPTWCLKRGFRKIKEISPFGTCLQTHLQKASNIHQIWASDSPLKFVPKFVHKFVCKFVCKFVNKFVKPWPKFRQLLLKFSSGAALNFVKTGPKFRQIWP